MNDEDDTAFQKCDVFIILFFFKRNFYSFLEFEEVGGLVRQNDLVCTL
jgi:hypothetical protein